MYFVNNDYVSQAFVIISYYVPQINDTYIYMGVGVYYEFVRTLMRLY